MKIVGEFMFFKNTIYIAAQEPTRQPSSSSSQGKHNNKGCMWVCKNQGEMDNIV